MSGRSRRGRSKPDIEALLIKYRNLGGIPFLGNESIIQIQAWMRSSKKIFEGSKLRDDQKRLLASWALKDEALIWWETIIRDNPDGNITWDRFKEIFNERFIPPEATERLYDEFYNLKQGDMTIQEYQNKFSELSRFAPELIQDPLRKNMRFIKGFQKKYEGRVLAHVNHLFSEMIQMAYRYEYNDKQHG